MHILVGQHCEFNLLTLVKCSGAVTWQSFILSRFLALNFFFFLDEPKETFLDVGLRST